MNRFTAVLLMTLVLSGCATPGMRTRAIGYYSGEWTFNGGHELWLRADGSYVWRQSLFYCGPDEHGNIGWFNEETGKWAIYGNRLVLEKVRRLISNSYVEGLYFDRHREFSLGGALGARVLVSGRAEDMVALKEEKDPNSDQHEMIPITDLRDHISIVTKEFLEEGTEKTPNNKPSSGSQAPGVPVVPSSGASGQ
jgi:hypothetical protein